jgi:hypothetical protein
MSKAAHKMLHRLAHDPEQFMEHAALYEMIFFPPPLLLSFSEWRLPLVLMSHTASTYNPAMIHT